MALKASPRCPVCKLIQTTMPQLEARLNRCSVYLPKGESMLNIYKDLGGIGPREYGTLAFSYNQLRTHTARHQAPNTHAIKDAIKRREIRAQANRLKDDQANAIVADAKARRITYRGHTTTRPELIQAVLDALAEGGVKLSGTNLVQLLGQEQKADERAKDRGLEMMKMVNFFAAGASTGSDKWKTRKYDDGDEGPVEGPAEGPIDSPIEGEVV